MDFLVLVYFLLVYVFFIIIIIRLKYITFLKQLNHSHVDTQSLNKHVLHQTKPNNFFSHLVLVCS